MFLPVWAGVAVAAQSEALPEQPPLEVEVGGVVVEAPPPLEPTLEELLQSFRRRLTTERLLAPIERPLAGGLVEVTTRFGRFCVPRASPFNWSDLTGSFALTAFCAFY